MKKIVSIALLLFTLNLFAQTGQLKGTNVWTGSNNFPSPVVAINPLNQFSGNGGGLTLSATNIASAGGLTNISIGSSSYWVDSTIGNDAKGSNGMSYPFRDFASVVEYIGNFPSPPASISVVIMPGTTIETNIDNVWFDGTNLYAPCGVQISGYGANISILGSAIRHLDFSLGDSSMNGIGCNAEMFVDSFFSNNFTASTFGYSKGDGMEIASASSVPKLAGNTSIANCKIIAGFRGVEVEDPPVPNTYSPTNEVLTMVNDFVYVRACTNMDADTANLGFKGLATNMCYGASLEQNSYGQASIVNCYFNVAGAKTNAGCVIMTTNNIMNLCNNSFSISNTPASVSYGYFRNILFSGSTAFPSNGINFFNSYMSATNLICSVIQTNWASGAFWTNNTGSKVTVYSDEVSVSAASGNTGFQLLYDPLGGHSWQTNCDGTTIQVGLSIVGMTTTQRLSGPVAAGGVICWTNVSTVGSASLKNGYYAP